MRTRFIGGMLGLLAVICFSSWGDEAGAETTNPPQVSADVTSKSATAGQPKDRRVRSLEESKATQSVRKTPTVHATEAEDRASEQTIRAQTAALIAEYNAKNSGAFGEWFLPNAEYETEAGNVLKGRAAIQEFFGDLFKKDPDVQARVETATVRLVSLHMAIEEGTIAVSHSPDEIEYESPYVAIWASADGRWRLASVREMTAPDEADTPHEHLQELGWLVGEWVDESSESVVKTTCRWSDNGNFLIQDFTTKIQGTSVMAGSHRIGWDPLRKKVRSWYFDSEGGYGEGFWSWDGERWVIPATTVSPNGETGTALNILVPVSSDSYRWEMSHRVWGDEALPDSSVLIVRHAPVPARTAPPTTAAPAAAENPAN